MGFPAGSLTGLDRASQRVDSAGHTVEKFCLTDAYPETSASGAGSALRQALFPRKAAAYVRENAERFDVIDCLIGVLPFSKDSLGFSGLVVARSVGLFRLYDRFLRQSRKVWPSQSKGRWFGRFFHRFIAWRSRSDSEKSIRTCDLLNLPNEDERRELADGSSASCSRDRGALWFERRVSGSACDGCRSRETAPAVSENLFHRYVGPAQGITRMAPRSWRPFGSIIQPRNSFSSGRCSMKQWCVQTWASMNYHRDLLPARLCRARLALAYRGLRDRRFSQPCRRIWSRCPRATCRRATDDRLRVPGPRQILRTQSERLLTPVSDTAAIAARAAEILSLSVPEYEKLSAECVESRNVIGGRKSRRARSHTTVLHLTR